MMTHVPVMLNEVLELLAPKQGASYLDCTFGGGGHTRALLEAAEGVRVVAMDCDPQAGERAEALKREYPDRFRFCDLNFQSIDEVPEGNFSGVLMDLGISSFHVDDAERGFSFNKDAPVDMRLNPREGISGAQFLEQASEDALIEAVRDFGEERSWRRVVTAILDARGTGKLQRTTTLADLIASVISKRGFSRIHPATKTFQGIRIAVNRELSVLAEALPKAVDKLAEGGVLAVISFHSLEDRCVKRFFKRMAGRPEHAGDSRSQMTRVARAVLLTNRPMSASAEEVEDNPRSRSAKLRALKKITQEEGK
ncbi:MAG: 16S rRNA (cytosine(1402)-N(4))-methyltransferase RsmH [Opitutales bacterium]